METSLQKAVRLAGGLTALAKGLGISPQAIQQWLKLGRAPTDRCPAIEALLRNQVTRYELRPDVFGIDPFKKGRKTQHGHPDTTELPYPVEQEAGHG